MWLFRSDRGLANFEISYVVQKMLFELSAVTAHTVERRLSGLQLSAVSDFL
jgi:hypothetical protein